MKRITRTTWLQASPTEVTAGDVVAMLTPIDPAAPVHVTFDAAAGIISISATETKEV